ncbi:SGNH/GDSL hydrolase family protein [Nocardioidaceae bacterium]|nr:SGNH/GDSL hydrolase family protein [Nocardioidaceae bacterium]
MPFTARRLLAAAAGVAMALATVPGVVGAPAAARIAGDGRGPLTYVALGDSYSAATGVLPLEVNAQPQCLRSERNYPSVIASRLGARLTDVSCGAADTSDFFTAQYDNVPRQLAALDRRTDLVTMTIGGNDSSVFSDAILSCGAAALTTLGRGNPCEQQYGRSFVRTVRQDTFPAIRKALRAVHRKAPNAEVAILSYPWILPKRVGCFPQMPVARGDVRYLRELQRVLNRVVRRAADATGTTFVGLNRASNGHDACQEIGVRWVEPVVLGTNPVIVHPNALGSRRMAARTIRVLRNN